MRTAIIFLTLAAAAASASPAIAHPEHDQVRAPVSPAQEARATVIRMITQSKLPASWARATVVETKARLRNGADQTVVTFRNDAEKRKARRMLYVVVANGSVVSTGHTLR